MHRRLAALVVLAVTIAGCSGSDEPGPTPTTSVPSNAPPPSTTGAPTTTSAPGTISTTPPDSTLPVTTTEPPDRGFHSPLESRLVGIGDEYFPYLGNPGYDVQHYTLAIDYVPADNQLRARASIDAVAMDDLGTFNLDFAGLEIDAVRVDGSAAEWVLESEELTVRPEAPISSGAAFRVQVDYSGSPGPLPSEAIPIDVGWIFAEDGSEAFVAAEPDRAHSWFPANDHPLDKATFDFHLTVPEGITAAANGSLEAIVEAEDGSRTFSWNMDDPMATYLATVVIGDFDIVVDEESSAEAGIPIRHVLPRGSTVDDFPGLERQGEMIAFLEDLFGPYPFDEYGIAIVEGLPTALENQTLSIFGTRMTNPALFQIVLIHELAHHWFGNSVSPGLWRDIWLNEGFATYAEWLWIEHSLGRRALTSGIDGERTRLGVLGLRPPGDPLSTDLFDTSVYRVGAMTLHALRLSVGDDVFFEILRIYHDRFAGSTATTFDFVDVAEEVSGLDLADFFESWLFGDEIPEFP